MVLLGEPITPELKNPDKRPFGLQLHEKAPAIGFQTNPAGVNRPAGTIQQSLEQELSRGLSMMPVPPLATVTGYNQESPRPR